MDGGCPRITAKMPWHRSTIRIYKKFTEDISHPGQIIIWVIRHHFLYGRRPQNPPSTVFPPFIIAMRNLEKSMTVVLRPPSGYDATA